MLIEPANRNIYLFLIFFFQLIPQYLFPTNSKTFQGITFIGNSYFSQDKLYELICYTIEDELSYDDLDRLLKAITDLYLSRGMLFIKIRLYEIVFIDDKLYAKILINEGAIVRIENFIFSGNKTIKEKDLIKYSGFKKNQIVTPLEIINAEKSLLAKPYIMSCSIIPMNENTLFIKVNEGNTTHFSGLIGYTNKKDTSNNFLGFIDLNFLNLFGTDRSLHFAWKQLESGYNSIFLKYHEVGPSTIPLSADFYLYREVKDSSYVKTKVETDIYYSFITQKIGITIGYTELFHGDGRPVLVDKQVDKQIGILWMGDFTDNKYNPRTGWEGKFKHSILFVKRDYESFQRHKLEMSFSNYSTLSKTMVFANSFSYKQLQNKSLSIYDLQKVGGTFTLRGFLEDSYAGDTIIYTNSELRYLMMKNSRIFVFLDYGYVEDNRKDFTNRFTDLFGIGFGFRLDTRVGLFRIDYGFNYSDKRWINPTNGIVHFGLEMGF